MELQHIPDCYSRFLWQDSVSWEDIQEIPWNREQLEESAKEDSRNKTILGKISPETSWRVCRRKELLYVVQWDNRIWLATKDGWRVFLLGDIWNSYFYGSNTR